MNDGKHTMYRGMFLIGSALLPCLAHAQNSSGTAGKDTAQRIDGYYEQRQPLQPERPVVDPVQPATVPAGQSGLADVRGSFVLREVRFSPSALLPKATITVVDDQAPILAFGEDGRFIPAGLPLPGMPVWLLFPGDQTALATRQRCGQVARLSGIPE